MLTVVDDGESANESGGAAARSLLDEIVRDGARRMLAAALRACTAAYATTAPTTSTKPGRTVNSTPTPKLLDNLRSWDV